MENVTWFSTWIQNIGTYFQENGWILLRNVVIVAAVILFTGPIAKKADHLVRAAFRRFGKEGSMQEKRAATVGTLVGSITRYALWFLGAAICLTVLGLGAQAGMAVATAGISGGVIIGFGAQKLLQDFFSGFVFLADHPFVVGDLVTIGGVTGTVESLKLRTTVINSVSGEKHILPNGSISIITNLSANNSLAVSEIFLPACRSLSEVRPVLEQAAARAIEGEEDVVDPPQVLGITGFTDRGMMSVRTILRTKPLKHWPIERKLRAFQLDALLEAGMLLSPADPARMAEGGEEH